MEIMIGRYTVSNGTILCIDNRPPIRYGTPSLAGVLTTDETEQVS